YFLQLNRVHPTIYLIEIKFYFQFRNQWFINHMQLFRIYFFIILFIFIGFPAILRGQLANTFNYNIDNGLPSNDVYSVLTDHLGYLWIATEKGVAKYNGYEFKIFNQSD